MKNSLKILIVSVLFVGSGFVCFVAGRLETSTASVAATQAVALPSTYDLWVLTNQERQKAGIAPVALDERLNHSATDKCADMVTRDYWSHNAPDGTEPWVFVQRYVDKYSTSGENLAQGFATAQDVTIGWMNSPTHKANLLAVKYNRVGYAICTRPTGKVVVVQHFTRD